MSPCFRLVVFLHLSEHGIEVRELLRRLLASHRRQLASSAFVVAVLGARVVRRHVVVRRVIARRQGACLGARVLHQQVARLLRQLLPQLIGLRVAARLPLRVQRRNRCGAGGVLLRPLLAARLLLHAQHLQSHGHLLLLLRPAVTCGRRRGAAGVAPGVRDVLGAHRALVEDVAGRGAWRRRCWRAWGRGCRRGRGGRGW